MEDSNKLIPKPIIVGLYVFCAVLCSLFVFLDQSNFPIYQIFALVFTLHLVVIPLLFVAGAKLVNYFFKENITLRNALALGILISVVFALWKMGGNS